MTRRYDHVDLRVPSLAEARPFYEVLLPALGFTRDDSNEAWLEFEFADGDRVTDYFALTESCDFHPGQTRIAFWAESAGAVDALAVVVREAGARNIEGPGFESDSYYAVFFEDPAGNRFEICWRSKN